ncbi:MAG: hypothetical protein MZV63_30640, partial [Marinilabiliales bacterium]|nr:hypothetical protein [Marinilabiliales bacterium]
MISMTGSFGPTPWILGPKTRTFLLDEGFHSMGIDHVCMIVETISFKGAAVSQNMGTIEGKIVCDADKLDAL